MFLFWSCFGSLVQISCVSGADRWRHLVPLAPAAATRRRRVTAWRLRRVSEMLRPRISLGLFMHKVVKRNVFQVLSRDFIFRRSATKSRRSFRVMYVLSWWTPPHHNPPNLPNPPTPAGLTPLCHVTEGALGLCADEANLFLTKRVTCTCKWKITLGTMLFWCTCTVRLDKVKIPKIFFSETPASCGSSSMCNVAPGFWSGGRDLKIRN